MRIENDNKLMICLSLFLFLTLGIIQIIITVFEIPLYIDLLLCYSHDLIACFIVIMWGVSVNIRIIYRDVRMLLECISIGMLLLIISMICRYGVIEETNLSRYTGYLFQINFFAICFLSFLTALQIGRTYEKRNPAYWAVAAGLAMSVEMLIATNDYHQLIYEISPEGETWVENYGGGRLYYWLIVLEASLWLLTIVVIERKCQKSRNSYRLNWLLMGTVITVSAYSFWYSISDLHLYEQPVASCFLTIAVWEICIQQRVFPSNSGYKDFFEKSSVPMLVTNMKGEIIYKSLTTEPISREQLKNAISKPCIINGSHRLSSHAIKGGRSYWIDDISELNCINEELKNVVCQLGEQGEILKAEANIRSERRQIDIQNSLYEKFIEKNFKKFGEIQQLLAKSENRGNPEILLKACIEMTFYLGIAELEVTKLRNDTKAIVVLEIYLKNLFHQLELYGIKSNMQITANGYISSESVSMLYTRLGKIVVSDYENLRCVEILITDIGKTVEMRTELSDIAGNKRSIVFAVSKVGDV